MNDTVKKHLIQSIKILKDMNGYNELIQTAENERLKSKEFEGIAELAVSLTTRGLQDRHWQELKEKTNIDCTDQTKDTTLTMIVGENTNTVSKEVINVSKSIADKAGREFQIKEKLEFIKMVFLDLN